MHTLVTEYSVLFPWTLRDAKKIYLPIQSESTYFIQKWWLFVNTCNIDIVFLVWHFTYDSSRQNFCISFSSSYCLNLTIDLVLSDINFTLIIQVLSSWNKLADNLCFKFWKVPCSYPDRIINFDTASHFALIRIFFFCFLWKLAIFYVLF